MLEDRPIVQRSLIGFGAFSFVFTAAMAGTAFMISGGFGLGGDERPHPRSVQDYAIATETAWSDWTQPAYAATQTEAAPSAVAPAPEPEAYQPTAYATADDLAGEARSRIEARREADILRDINRELDSYQATYESEAAPVEEPAYTPAPQDDVAAAKERAAAMEGYSPY